MCISNIERDMKLNHKDQITGPPGSQQTRFLNKLSVLFLVLLSVFYLLYTSNLVSSASRACDNRQQPIFTTINLATTITNSSLPDNPNPTRNLMQIGPHKETQRQTELKDIVFGIGASSKLWNQRKNYIKLWYKPETMRAFAWLDNRVKTRPDENLPPVKISGDTSKFPYSNKQGHRSGIRISRIVAETMGLGLENVRWFVMGDDDTVFVTDNLVRVLRKYDHNGYWYIGSLSESHLQNIFFSYGMAYGGGGFAISYPLAKALVEMQDRCLQRYPGLYGSDDRMQACMAELGVPLTKEVGFHQFDVYGNLFGLLAAHPVAPLVSLHHLDVVEPIFPNVTRVQALQHLMVPTKLDSAAILQQSICYDKAKKWTISVSWGYAVQIFRGIFSPREIELPARTFLNWYKRADYTAYALNTRPVKRNVCQKPFVFFLSKAKFDSSQNSTVTEYVQHRVPHPECRWKMPNPADVDVIIVRKKLDAHLWDRSPRRNCCRVMESGKKGSVMIDIGICREGEVTEI